MEPLNFYIIPLLAFVISFLLFPVLIKLLTKWELYDSLKEHKIHQSFTPSMGGMAIYAGLLIALLIGLPLVEWLKLKYFFIASSLMFIIGLRDDILSLSAIKKLVGQLLPIFILVIFGKVIISGPVFSFELGDLPDWILTSLTIVTFILITNSYNLIDGLDGLAGSVGIICMSFFGIWFYLIDESHYSLIAFCISGVLLAFIIFNWQPSKIFMGDTGALLIGLTLSYFSVQFLNINESLESIHPMKFDSSVGMLVCVLIIPIFDTSRVVIFRLRKGLSPFRADKNHIHHQFLKLGYDHAAAVVRIGILNLSFIGLGLLLQNQPDSVVIPLVVVLCLFINFGLKWAQKNAGTLTKTI